jgi:hypothetical protein
VVRQIARARGAIEQDDIAPDDRRRLAMRAELTNQSRGSPLDPRDRKLREFGRHIRPGAERDHVVIVVLQTGSLAVHAPEFVCEGRSHPGSHDGSIPSARLPGLREFAPTNECLCENS